uniref:SFI1 centrin binding protein n=1 Tax=Capra hircus TaxID=9925 RepID=A0A8C2S192_CAPHI
MKNLLTEKCSHWLNFQQKKIKQRMERKVDSRSFRDSAVKKPYSPKILSTKKSSAFSGSRSEGSRASQPVKYHPSQARTRRDRLRELRVRLYYEQKILRKVFEEWKEEWWVSHREWKLRVRADCHYRYYLYSLMFQTWKTYVYQQREMRSKYLRAENHAKQKMRQAWKSWLIYVVFRRTKLQMQTTALEFRQRSILWVWWSAWRRRLGRVRLGRALQATAMKHWAQSLQLQAWSRWQEQLLFVWRERRKTVSAVKHLQRRQQWRALRAWLEYLQLRREKRLQNQMAERVHCTTLLQTHFCAWRRAWARRESLHAHHARVEGLARRTLLRRALTHWKHYTLLCTEEAERWKAAGEHHRRGLLLLHRVWNLWQSRLEQREEREQLPFLRAAWDHSRITLLRKCFQLWSQSTQKRRSQQLLQARADCHFQQRALPAAFQAWRRLWRWCQQQRALEARAASFHREMLQKQVFAIWCQKTSQHQEHRLAERMAVLHAEQHLLQQSWSTWRQRAAAHRLEQQQHALACAHHHLGRLRRAFCVWREGARGLRAERMGSVRAARFHVAWLLRWAWTRWRERRALRSAEWQKLARADLHHQHSLLHRALQTWGVYQSQVRSVLQEAAARESRHKRRLLRRVLHRWRENTVAQADETKKTSRAAAHYRRTLCSKVLLEWRAAASVQVYFREQADGAVREAQLVLRRGRLKTWFRCWRDRSRRAAQQRLQMEQAVRHYCRKLLQEALARWKVHHQGCVRKRLQQRQAARLLAQMLSRACFHQWRRQLLDRRHERQHTARALWFWAFSLQAKAWAAWRGLVQETRRKKAREEQAAQVYHLQLLREGVERLLRFAAGTKAFRQQLHAQQQVQAAHSLHRAVRRCATLWKQKALGRGREPQSPVSTEPSRRVTFEPPLPSHVAAGAGDAPLETKRPPAPRGLWGALDGLASAPGDPQLLELNAARWARKQPRRPSFLAEHLQSRASQALWECGLHQVRPVGPTRSALDPSSPLPRASGLKPPPTVHPSPELLPPSSFAPCGAQVPVWRSAQPVTPGLPSHVPPSLAGVPSPRLLLPEDFKGTRPGPGSDPAGHSDVEAELESIRQQLQDYQTTRQNLRSCQRQAHSLRRWLELSREEPRAEDQEAEQQVQEELRQVEVQIQQLAHELQARRQPVHTCIARVQALRRALC